jgi:hypothetical protein
MSLPVAVRVGSKIKDMQRSALELHPIRDLQEVLGGASEPVELGHDQNVALADEIEAGFKLGSFFDRRNLLLKNFLAASAAKVTKLGLHPGPLIQSARPPVSDPQTALPVSLKIYTL